MAGLLSSSPFLFLIFPFFLSRKKKQFGLILVVEKGIGDERLGFSEVLFICYQDLWRMKM